MNLRPMEIRDNPAVAQLIRASLEEFGLDKPGTVYFDSHLDHLADYYQQQERAAYFILEDEGQLEVDVICRDVPNLLEVTVPIPSIASL